MQKVSVTKRLNTLVNGVQGLLQLTAGNAIQRKVMFKNKLFVRGYQFHRKRLGSTRVINIYSNVGASMYGTGTVILLYNFELFMTIFEAILILSG